MLRGLSHSKNENEFGQHKNKVTFKLEAPGGLIKIDAKCDPKTHTVTEVKIEGYPSFVALEDIVQVPTLGAINVSIAYGGMWYVIVDAHTLPMSAGGPLELVPANGKRIVRIGEMIKAAAREKYPVNHPELDYPGPDILVFTSPPSSEGGSLFGRNAVVMSNGSGGLSWSDPETWTGMLDRSPCGTGTCAVMALLHARGMLSVGQPFFHESVVGSVFVGRLLRKQVVGAYDAVVPEIAGRAWITSYAELFLDPTDPFPDGFTVGDIWAS